MPDTLNVIKKSEQGLMELIEATPEALEVAPASHGHDAAEIVSGIISLDRLPPTEGVIVASGNITTLTAPQQAAIVEGTLVVLGTGEQYRYKGSGSKTDLASYVAQVASVGWSAITGKPDLEPALGDPGAGNWFLKTVSVVRSWVQLGALAFLDNITDSQVASGAAIAWAKISKTGAAPSDIGALASASPTVASGRTTLAAATAAAASLRVPTTATGPAAPSEGDIWGLTKTLAMYGKGLSSILAKSNTYGAGSRYELLDALTPTAGYSLQLNASGGLDFWRYNGTAWAIEMTLSADGELTLPHLAGTGTRPLAVDSSGGIVIESPSEPSYTAGGIAVGNAVTLDAGVTSVTSIFLSEGVWDVEGVASVYVQFGQTLSAVSCDINAAGTVATNGSQVYAGQQTIPAGSTVSITIPRRRIVTGVGSTEIFLAVSSSPSPVGPKAFGYITARKVL